MKDVKHAASLIQAITTAARAVDAHPERGQIGSTVKGGQFQVVRVRYPDGKNSCVTPVSLLMDLDAVCLAIWWEAQ